MHKRPPQLPATPEVSPRRKAVELFEGDSLFPLQKYLYEWRINRHSVDADYVINVVNEYMALLVNKSPATNRENHRP